MNSSVVIFGYIGGKNMLLKQSGINFNNLTAEGYTAFVLAIIFTIVTLAAFIYYVRHRGENGLVATIVEYILPTVTVFCWMYLIFNVTNFEVGKALLYAFITAIAFLVVAVAIGLIIVGLSKKSENTEENVAAVAEEKQEEKDDDVLVLDAPVEAEEVVVEETTEEAPAEEQPVEETEEAPVEEAPAEEEAPVEETPVEEEPAEETEEAKVEGVIFTKGPKETFAEQLAKVPEEILALYNEILEYAQAKEETKTMESNSHVMVKIGRLRLLELKFLREKLVCKFMAGSSELKNYSLAEKSIKIKEKPITIELENESSLAVAKNMVDIVYKNILEAKEDKKLNDVVAPVSDEVEENGENE